VLEEAGGLKLINEFGGGLYMFISEALHGTTHQHLELTWCIWDLGWTPLRSLETQIDDLRV